MKSAKDLVAEVNSRVTTVTVQDAVGLVNDPETAFVDLRDSSELQRDGKIPGAVHVNHGMLEFTLDPILPYHNPVFSSGNEDIVLLREWWTFILSRRHCTEHGIDASITSGRRFQELEGSERPSR